MIDRKHQTTVAGACSLFETLFGPAPQNLQLQDDAGFSMMEHASFGPPSDAHESMHVFDILQNVRRKLLREGKTIYHLYN